MKPTQLTKHSYITQEKNKAKSQAAQNERKYIINNEL